MRLKNLIVVTERLQDELGQLDPGHAAALANLSAVARATAEQAAALCAADGATPAELPLPSRRAFQWLTFLPDPDQAAAAGDALAPARHVLAQAGWPRPRPLAGCPGRLALPP